VGPYFSYLVILLAELAGRLSTFMFLFRVVRFVVSSFTIAAVLEFTRKLFSALNFTALALLVPAIGSDTSAAFITDYLVAVLLDLLVKSCYCLDTFKVF
jgi:hypothetical protein